MDDAALLRRAVEIVARKDAGAFRQLVFRDLASHSPLVRGAVRLHRLLGLRALRTAYVGLYGLAAFLTLRLPAGRADAISFAQYRNEQRQFDHLASLVPELEVRRAELGRSGALRPAAWWALLGALPAFARAWPLLRDHAGDFLVGCRVAATVGTFLRLRPLLGPERTRGLWVSSDTNPLAMGAVFAGKARGVPSIYVNHGHLPEGPPALDFLDLSILDGEALLDVYRRSGPVVGRVVFRGSEGRYRPMELSGLSRARPRIGVFVSLIVDWPRLGRILEALLHALDPELLLVRMHPNKVIRHPDALAHLPDDPRLAVSDGDRVLLGDAERCDLVIAGESSCHLTVLKYGVPTLYLPDLDRVPGDFYRFLAERIVAEAPGPEAIDLAAIARFYADADWPARFQRFDSAYPGHDAERDRETAEAIRDTLLPGSTA